MPQRSTVTVKMSRGVYASSSLFDVPQGYFLRLLNLLPTVRGALKFIDGSHITSQFPNGFANITEFFIAGITQVIRNPLNAPSQDLAIAMGQGIGANWHIDVYRIDLNPGVPKATYATGVTAAGQTIFYGNSAQFGNGALVLTFRLYNPTADVITGIISGGPPPLLYATTFPATLTPLTNTFDAADTYPNWTASTPESLGNFVIAMSGGVNYLFKCIYAGTTGSSPPAWPATINAKVADGTTSWQNVGAATNLEVPNAEYIFNFEGLPIAWSTYLNFNGVPLCGIAQGDLNNPQSWNPAFAAGIGEADGQAAMGGSILAMQDVGIPTEAQLVLFKTLSTYVLTNTFPTPQITQINSGVGCVAPGTIQYIPGLGAMRLSTYGVALFNGVGDVVDEFTDPIRPYLFGGADDITPVDWSNIQYASSFVTSNPPGYAILLPQIGGNGLLTLGLFYDRFAKAWFPFNIPTDMNITAGNSLLGANATVTPLISGIEAFGGPPPAPQEFDGVVHEVFAGDTTWDTGDPITASLRTPPMGEPNTTKYYRRLELRIDGPAKTPVLSGTLNAQTVKGVKVTQALAVPRNPATPGPSVTLDIGRTYLGGAYVDVSMQRPTGDTNPIVVQGIELHTMPKPPSRVG